MSTGVPVQVLLNMCEEHEFLEYEPTCCLLKVAVEYEVKPGSQDEAVLEDAWVQFNVGGLEDPVVFRFRHTGNRSLSVGDVVQIGSTRYAVARVGWKEIG